MLEELGKPGGVRLEDRHAETRVEVEHAREQHLCEPDHRLVDEAEGLRIHHSPPGFGPAAAERAARPDDQLAR